MTLLPVHLCGPLRISEDSYARAMSLAHAQSYGGCECRSARAWDDCETFTPARVRIMDGTVRVHFWTDPHGRTRVLRSVILDGMGCPSGAVLTEHTDYPTALAELSPYIAELLAEVTF